nr:glycine oxidase ThiO [Armatimonadota bacterium]
TPASDIVILGGGVIGLSIAWQLSRRGAHVTVIDAGHLGQASWAAAGMLAPLAETGMPGPLVDLCLDSLHAYPTFLEALREETCDAPTLYGPGMLRVAVTATEEDALCRALSWQKERGLPLEWLDSLTVRELEPGISPAVRMALLSPQEKHVTPRLLLGSLRQACLRRPISLLTETTVTGLRLSGDCVHAVQTTAGIIPCGQLLISGGAWSGQVGNLLGLSFPVKPVRGQMLSLTPAPSVPFRHTIYGHHRYLVPRADNQVVVGATEENVGFDTGTTATGVSSLLTAASALVPALTNAAIESVWTGLRPVSADGLPLLGRVPHWQNVQVASGHGRNGILLTPITSQLMAASLLDGAPPPSAFTPARFTKTP